jgi:hypothetical protein
MAVDAGQRRRVARPGKLAAIALLGLDFVAMRIGQLADRHDKFPSRQQQSPGGIHA